MILGLRRQTPLRSVRVLEGHLLEEAPAGAETIPVEAVRLGVIESPDLWANGIAIYDDYYYIGAGELEAFLRVDRETFEFEEFYADWDVSNSHNTLHAVDENDDGTADYIYLATWMNVIHYICTPASEPYFGVLVD